MSRPKEEGERDAAPRAESEVGASTPDAGAGAPQGDDGSEWEVAVVGAAPAGATAAEAWFSHHWLADLLAHRARRSQALREAMEGIVTETVHPRGIFSLRGLLRSLWR